jgi:hypothetical protein
MIASVMEAEELILPGGVRGGVDDRVDLSACGVEQEPPVMWTTAADSHPPPPERYSPLETTGRMCSVGHV